MTETAWEVRTVRLREGPSAVSQVSAVVPAVAIVAFSVLGAAGMIAGRVLGVEDGSTSLALALGGTVSAGVTATVAARLQREGRPIGRGIWAVAALLAGYLLVNGACALAVGLTGARGTGAELIVAATLAWFMIPMTAGQLVVLSAARRHGARGTGPARAVLIVTAAVGLVVGLAVVAPGGAYAELAAPLAALDSPVAQAVFGVASTLWMASVVAPGVVAWVSVRSARGTLRHRLALTAVAGILPAWTIALCVGLTPALFWDDSARNLGADLLALAFAVPFPLAAVALALADSADEDWLRRRAPGILVTSFSVAVAGIAAVVAAGVGVAIGATGPGALVPAIVVAVGISIVSGFLRHRWAAALAARLDPSPVPSLPTHGLARLSTREREVLALLSAGLSNAAIAAQLFVSERTIDTHVRSVFGKLGLDADPDANRRVQAAAIWLRASTESGRIGVSPEGTAPPRP